MQKIQYIALFLVALVLSIPFNSANAIASLSITRNSGNASVDGFVNARGDIWNLEVLASIAGETIAPSQVKMNSFPFTQCTQVPGGSSACTYTVDFRTTPLPQTTVPINVQLFKRDGSLSDAQSTSLSFDGSAPSITNVVVRQDGSNIRARFTVKDEPQACSGLKSISFFEGSTLLQAFEGADIPQGCQPDTFERLVTYPTPTPTNGTKTITVKVADKLGNERSLPAQFFYDAAPPRIQTTTFAIGNFHGFVPQGQVSTGFSVNVIEERAILTAELSIPQLQVNGEFTSCTKTDPAHHNFTCSWPARSVTLGQAFTATIIARDGGNNTDTQTLSSGFVADATKPVVDFFGTPRQYAGINYITQDNGTIVVRLTERESGMSAAGIAADLSGLNARYGQNVRANECRNTGQQWECFWRGLSVSPGSTHTIALVRAEDNVGNVADNLPSANIELDVVAPNITNVTWKPIGQQEDRDAAQSGDNLDVRFAVSELNGLSEHEADVSAIVSNGGTVPVNCNAIAQAAGTYDCNLLTDHIKTGPATYPIKLMVRDTAGNKAEKAFSVEIFGTADVQNPDFWERKEVKCSPKGLDVNVVKLAPQRVFCSVKLETGAQNVELVSTRLVNCPDPDGLLNRAQMMNNFRGSTSPAIVLEFHQFEAQSQNFSTQCTLRLQTKRGDKVIQQTEDEQVNITVPFFVTKYDDALGTIEDKIEDAKDYVKNDLWQTIGVLTEIFEVVRAICIASPFIIVIIEVAAAIKDGTDPLREFIVTAPIAIGACSQQQAQEGQLSKISEYIQMLCAFTSCSPNSLPTFQNAGVQWYVNWQKSVLEVYNQLSLRGPIGMPATSLYDNIVLSTAGICLPGIIYNLDKYRQIECRHIFCLENEVKSGIATVESCRELEDYQVCKYFVGEIFQIVPFVGAFDTLLGTLKSMATDPAGLIAFALTILAYVCGAAWCGESGSGANACDFITFFLFLMSAVNAFITSFSQVETAVKSNYCKQVL